MKATLTIILMAFALSACSVVGSTEPTIMPAAATATAIIEDAQNEQLVRDAAATATAMVVGTPTPTLSPTQPAETQVPTSPTAEPTPPPTATPTATPTAMPTQVPTPTAMPTPTATQEPQPVSSFQFRYRNNGDWGDKKMISIVVFTNDTGIITQVVGVDAGKSFDIEQDTQGWVYLFENKYDAVQFANLRGVNIPRYWVGDRPEGYNTPPKSWATWEFPPDEQIFPGGAFSDWTFSLEVSDREIETKESEWVYCQLWNTTSGEVYHFVVTPSAEEVDVPYALQGKCWSSVGPDDQLFVDMANQATVWAVDRDDISKSKLHRLIFGDVSNLEVSEGWEVSETPSFP